MQIPAAEQIEGAADSITTLSDFVRTDQLAELREAMGADTIKKLGAPLTTSDDFNIGYTLGLQVARTMLSNSAKLAIAGIDPGDLL
jgi:hypothetical protein